ncbi:hypothetical protein NHX12_011706 [Muraenolepis orangiensis]|uniref:Uncharacterized protein n=1 Tax=Muraenolepis orangiensis TaxID=630683 RepID=A0A9Q0DGW2_9TELE|nr:hypothetical protein NHX12_011706 [Muraenolepis orangiensis]
MDYDACQCGGTAESGTNKGQRPYAKTTTTATWPRFWYADTQPSSGVRPRAQHASSTGHRGPRHPRDETPDWHVVERLMWGFLN